MHTQNVKDNDSTRTPAPPNQVNNIVSGKDKLDAYIDRIKYLPPTPSLMIKLLVLLRESSPEIDEVVKLLSRDPSLTTEVLKLCNSSCFGGERVVADMFEATARLGFSEVSRVIMMTSATRTISLENVESVLEVEALCRHSTATAVAARAIATTVGEAEDFAFVAGLLHDIGKIALASANGVGYKNLTREVTIQGGSLSEMEKKYFGFDHSEVGSRLLERWGIPPEVVLAVRHHHNLAEASVGERLTATVVLGNMIVHDGENKSACDGGSRDNIDKAVALLNLGPAKLSTIMDQAHEALKRDAGLLRALLSKRHAT